MIGAKRIKTVSGLLMVIVSLAMTIYAVTQIDIADRSHGYALLTALMFFIGVMLAAHGMLMPCEGPEYRSKLDETEHFRKWMYCNGFFMDRRLRKYPVWMNWRDRVLTDREYRVLAELYERKHEGKRTYNGS